ncbi:MAG: M50 family metallopeptidase [Nannocystaceae bacterium]
MAFRRTTTDWHGVLLLLGLTAAVAALWDTPVVYPLKILVVFFHELSHGLMAVLTGGEIVEIQVVKEQGGLCITRGGSRILTLSAGYLGSLVWGGAILTLAARTRLDRGVAVVLGAILLAVTAIFVRPVIGFGFGFGVASSLVLILLGLKLSERVCDLVLRVIGLTSCLYAVLDIKSDILDRPEVRSDAAMLAEVTGLPTTFWGVLWISVAVLSALGFLYFAARREERGLAALSGRRPPA